MLTLLKSWIDATLPEDSAVVGATRPGAIEISDVAFMVADDLKQQCLRIRVHW